MHMVMVANFEQEKLCGNEIARSIQADSSNYFYEETYPKVLGVLQGSPLLWVCFRVSLYVLYIILE